MKYIVGIDASLTNTGIVILDRQGKFIDDHLIKSKPIPNRMERLDRIRSQIINFTHPYVDDKLFAIEGYAFSRPNQAHQLGELGGVIRMMHYVLFDCEITEYAPATMKKFITGKGNTKKVMIPMYVYKKYGYETDSPDKADAFGIAQLRFAHWQVVNGKGVAEFLGYEQEVLRQIINPKPKKRRKK